MISGALLLPPNKEITIEKLLKKYVLRYSLVLLIFGWGYAYLELLFKSRRFVLSEIWISLCNMLQGKSWAHMWYLYTLIGLMLVLPILRAVVARCTGKEMAYLLIIFFVFNSVFPMITAVNGKELGVELPIVSVYLMYMLLGYVMDNRVFKMSNALFFLIETVCVAILIITAYLDIMQMINLPFGAYNSPIIVVFATMLFGWLKEANLRESRIIAFLSSVSFGVYITHMIWINMAFKFIKLNPVSPTSLIGVAIAIVTLLLSVSTTWIMKKIPVLKGIV